jgi:GNAT superfamily N-acetyltransferase
MAEITEAPARIDDQDGETVTLGDGGRVFIRTLRPSDRDELAERYLQLSPQARRLRFFNAPDRLSTRLLDYLVDVDGVDRCALVAFAIDDAGTPGVGIARYSRSREDPTCAEAAVTVLDAYQNRGIATVLLHRLVDRARGNGISTLTASVMWENRALLDGLRSFGAEVMPSEPGVASVRVAVPPSEAELPETELHRMLRVFAERVGDAIGLRFEG